MSEAAAPAVTLEIRERIAYLTLSRPDAANTMNLAFGREFRAAVRSIEGAADVRAVLIAGQGRNFCFGGDLKGMMASGADMAAYLSELTTDLHAGLAGLRGLSAPVVAAVKGTAAGAGLGLVLAADLAIAARSAKFAPAYTGVGLSPDGGCTFWLPRTVGYKRAMEWLMSNRVLDAEQALAWGLVNQIVEDEELDPAADALTARLSAGARGAFGALKRLMAESEPGLHAQLERESLSIAARGNSAEGREGIAAFLEKRVPRF